MITDCQAASSCLRPSLAISVAYIPSSLTRTLKVVLTQGQTLFTSTCCLQLLKFSGCYHGHADSFLVQAGSGVATLGLPDSPGVPAASTGTAFNPTLWGALLPECKLCGSICTLAWGALCSKICAILHVATANMLPADARLFSFVLLWSEWIHCPERLLSSTCSNLK